MTLDDLSWVDSTVRRPPVAILSAPAAFICFGLAGLVLRPVVPWSAAGYTLCSLGAISAIGLYRLSDGRLRTHPGYRMLRSATRASQVLLVAAWLVSVADAWRLATELSR